jgi:hypothetical protein
MWRILNFRSIRQISSQSSRPGFRCAISKGLKPAAVIIACCLAVSIDHRAALADSASDRDMANRYEQAAQAGDDDAQFYIGALYSAGVGRPRSDQEAFRWFQRAADQGQSHAMLMMAGLYASGRGVGKDNVKAYSWAHIVASASKVDEYRDGARQLMSLLMKKMTSDEIGRAVVAARAWRAVRVNGSTKDSNIERAADGASGQAASAPVPPATVSAPAPAVVQAPAAAPSVAVTQPAQSNVTVLPAPSKVISATPIKNAKRDDARELLDQVPTGLRKRFGF